MTEEIHLADKSAPVWLDHAFNEKVFNVNLYNPGYEAHLRRLDKRIIIIVNGYGCHFHTPLGWTYLPKVTRFIMEKKELIAAVIFCGGFTEISSPGGLSEAALMERYVRVQLGNSCPPTYIEQDSYTTYENSQRAAKKIEKVVLPLLGMTFEESVRNIRIVHFCEALRTPTVAMLDRRFMAPYVESIDDITIETASWERADPFELNVFKWTRWFQIPTPGSLFYNWFALKLPWLGLAERESAKRRLRSKNK